jgi:hypothetical protein
MNRQLFKWIVIIAGLLAGMGIYFFIRLGTVSSASLFSEAIPTPKSTVEITHSLGWWAYQRFLGVDSIQTEIIQSRLNLFNSHTLVAWTVRGTLRNPDGLWKPRIEKVHLTERYIDYHPEARISFGEIALTPIVAVTQDSLYHGEPITFSFHVEDVLQSGTWGVNTYCVRCDAGQTLFSFTNTNRAAT